MQVNRERPQSLLPPVDITIQHEEGLSDTEDLDIFNPVDDDLSEPDDSEAATPTQVRYPFDKPFSFFYRC